VQHAPYDFDIVDTYAEVLEKLNRCGAAISAGLRAAHRAREADQPSVRRTTKRWIDRKSACREHEEPLPDVDAAVATTGPSDPAATASARPEAGPAAAPQRDHALAAGSQDVAPGRASANGTSTPMEQATDEAFFYEPHSGWALSGKVGFGYVFGTFEAPNGFSGSLDGTAIDASVAAGFWFVPELSMSIEAGFLSHSFSDEPIKNAKYGSTNGVGLARLGLLADLYMSRSSPLHLELGFDLVRGAWHSEDGIFVTNPLSSQDGLTGYLTHASAGFAWRVSGAAVGPSLRFCHGSAEGDSTSALFTELALVLNAGF
jgi:hypothetical protein